MVKPTHLPTSKTFFFFFFLFLEVENVESVVAFEITEEENSVGIEDDHSFHMIVYCKENVGEIRG